MREAVIVSQARTGIGKAYRGAFNDTPAPTLASFAITGAVRRAGIDPALVPGVMLNAGPDGRLVHQYRMATWTGKTWEFDGGVIDATPLLTQGG